MDVQEMMKQAKVMQDRMQQMQADLAEVEVTGESGGGLVSVVMTCRGEVRKLNVSKEIVNPDDKETMEDLVVAALNAARQNADRKMAEETQNMMKELGLPANMELPM
jgi:DNA-binding YbaB/EbfC family protein